MGVSKYDREKAQRTLEERYPLVEAAGVRKVLDKFHEINSEASTDYLLTEMIADLGTAIKKANLSLQERWTIQYKFVERLEDNEISSKMKVTEEVVKDLIDSVTERIAAVFREWRYND
jgi:predicted DNA-binding protein (UPF0251 family)